MDCAGLQQVVEAHATTDDTYDAQSMHVLQYTLAVHLTMCVQESGKDRVGDALLRL
jgi:hypothetical protein